MMHLPVLRRILGDTRRLVGKAVARFDLLLATVSGRLYCSLGVWQVIACGPRVECTLLAVAAKCESIMYKLYVRAVTAHHLHI
jgi:hypothetical protein